MALRMQREYEVATAEEGCADFSGPIQGVSQGAPRVQKVLRLQTQEADHTPQGALRLQEQAAALHETVRQMGHQLQEKEENIRALRQELDVRMRVVERRMDFLEEQFRGFRGGKESEEGSKEELKELVELDGVKSETSAESSLGTVFPRVDALVAELEKRLPLRVPCASPSPNSTAGSSLLRSPSAGAVGAPATKADAAGARKEPASSCQRPRTPKQEHERQQEELRLRQASAKVERALAALGLA